MLEATKWNVLKFLASIFDPLGFFAPSVLGIKVFLQQCWKKKYDWSEFLPSLLEAEWNKLHSNLIEIPNCPIPRRIWKFNDNDNGQISLHIFCDASKLAYACCAYLVYFDPTTCESASTLIIAKVRTAPVKILSIPRLELLGVLIRSRMAINLRNSLDVSLFETVIWTDSTTVIQWLNTTLVLPQFVHNRVVEIKRIRGNSVRFTSGKQNPADIATRGETPKDLIRNKLWWNGPIWITCRDTWPEPP